MLLVTGAASITGRHIVHELRAAGKPHRALVPAREIVTELEFGDTELVVGEATDSRALDAALDGVSAVILVTRASPRQVALERTLVAALQRHRVRRLVKLSSIGSRRDAAYAVGRWHWESERLIAATTLDWTIVRAHRPFQHIYSQLGSLLGQHAFYGTQGEGASADVDQRDVATVLQHIASDDAWVRKTLEVSGPAAVTPSAVARALGHSLGYSIAYVDCTPSDFINGQRAGGLDMWQAEGRAAWQSAARAGHFSNVTDVVREITGRAPRTLESFASEFATAVRYARVPSGRRARSGVGEPSGDISAGGTSAGIGTSPAAYAAHAAHTAPAAPAAPAAGAH